MQIIENIWQVGGEGFSSTGDAAIYLLADKGEAALIDAGTGHGHKNVLTNISKCLSVDISIKNIFLTHCHFDHSGGAEKFRKEYGLKIISHSIDADILCEGHYGVIEGKEKVKRFIAQFVK